METNEIMRYGGIGTIIISGFAATISENAAHIVFGMGGVGLYISSYLADINDSLRERNQNSDLENKTKN